MATVVCLKAGRYFETGSVSSSRPSSSRIATATVVIAFDIEAMRRITSLRIGTFLLDVHPAVGLEMHELAGACHDGGDARNASLVHVVLHHGIQPLEARARHAHRTRAPPPAGRQPGPPDGLIAPAPGRQAPAPASAARGAG